MKKNRWIITLLALILLLSSCTKAPQTPANTQQTPAESELVQTPAEVQVETPSETDPHISETVSTIMKNTISLITGILSL